MVKLVEDYADEWMWRPALHYRWSYERDALLLSGRIANEMAGENLAADGTPGNMAKMLRMRQYQVFVKDDGVNDDTWDHVESIYLGALDYLQAMFETRPFLLGDKPSFADFGFMASMFRHFSLDPTPQKIMMERAPAVYAWVARMWNAKHDSLTGEWVNGIPDDWSPMLRDIGGGYLRYLTANALAWKEGKKKFDVEIQGTQYMLPVIHYRVWCRERLQGLFNDLDDTAKATVEKVLTDNACWEPLWDEGTIESNFYIDPPPVCRPLPESEAKKYAASGTPWDVAQV